MANPIKRTISVIREMYGKTDLSTYSFNRAVNIFTSTASKVQTVDYEQTNYDLTRAIYYASVVRGADGKNYGEKFLLGAIFGKPIVNSVAGFAFASMPEVEITKNGNPDDDTTRFINKWISDNKKTIFNTLRWSIRDGDSYLLIKSDLSPVTIHPSRVTQIVDILSGELIGFDIKSIVEEESVTYTYVTEYRHGSDIRVLKYKGSDTVPEVIVGASESSEKIDLKYSEGLIKGDEKLPDEDKPLPIVGFHNDKEASAIYGNSEYQNVYYLMANYHGVFSNAIQNNIYNSSAQPYIRGIEDVQKFLQDNGERDATGEYKLKLETDSVLIGNKDFKFDFATTGKNADDTNIILKKIFQCLCIGSETPEFAMGTAVKSSNASVAEQTPVMLQKAERKRTESEEEIKQLIRVVVYLAKLAGEKVDPDYDDADIKFPPMLDKDMKLTKDIVEFLSSEGVITDRVKMVMLNMDLVVDDIEAEIERASAEYEAKQKNVDNYQFEPERIDKELDKL